MGKRLELEERREQLIGQMDELLEQIVEEPKGRVASDMVDRYIGLSAEYFEIKKSESFRVNHR